MSNHYWFNRNPVVIGPRAYAEPPGLIEATPNLRRASLSNAALFGGPLLRQLLQSAPIVGDHKHILVDTKVSMLMPGWWPAIPGWHTDGVPRYSVTDKTVTPANWGMPSLPLQNDRSLEGYYPRYHTLHVGNDCPTVFIDGLMHLPIEHDDDEQMYSEMTRRIDGCTTLRKLVAQEAVWHSWDWWNIHQASQATERGWRLLIRITESDQPPADSDFIRSQNQVYVPREFGW
ncbi:hypothetical protein PROPHIGD54-2_130 [Mycobacterium phage prophiGD54-2]|uniref:hypothetical protein n=1 Tax=Mycobacteroides abscessus TaxID=36809 RepID=UPI0019D00021|nr:hypothetical protein [Mycobacteroides abscessus]QSM04708.1 hypothetical protein PROPHIGD54-2_130 [Mycobacterium phage prophiGD54-2]QSN19601.1 hypothetical protein I3U41_16875 [Mycobacteroides abscessus subsp. abscessus]